MMVNRSTVRMGVVAVVAVALFRWTTANVPALKRFSGVV